MLTVYGLYNINGVYVPPCTRDNDKKDKNGGHGIGIGNGSNYRHTHEYGTDSSRKSPGQSGGGNITAISKTNNGNGDGHGIDTNDLVKVNPFNIFNYIVESDGTRGISTKDFQEDNGYIVGQSSTGITRVNAPSYKDIEFTINGEPKMMIDSQGKVYINSDDHAAHFSEQLNVNGNIRTNGAYIGSKVNDKGTTMMIGHARHMTNPNSHDTNFSLAHHHDGTTRINSTNALHFAINGNSQMMINNKGMVGINEVNPQESMHVKGNVRIDGDMSINGTLVSDSLTAHQYSERLNALEQKYTLLNTTMATLKSEHDKVKNKVASMEPTVRTVSDIDNKVKRVTSAVSQFQKNADTLQNEINTMRQKLDSVVNVKNIKDVHDIYEQLSFLQDQYDKINRKITLLMSH